MAIYHKIATQLRDEISARYRSGDLLPSENQLAGRFDVNRHTVRRAIDELVQVADLGAGRRVRISLETNSEEGTVLVEAGLGSPIGVIEVEEDFVPPDHRPLRR